MSEVNYYYVTIPSLRDNTQSKFYGKVDVDAYKDTTSTELSGDMYFDREFIKNNKQTKNYMDGVLVGKIDFRLDDIQEDADSFIYISSDSSYEDRFQHVRLYVACNSTLFESLILAAKNGNEVCVKFQINEWREKTEYSDSKYFADSRCKVITVEILPPKTTNEDWFAKRRRREIEYHLLTEFCGGRTDGQIPTICKEFSVAFEKQENYNRRNEIIEQIRELIGSIRWTLELEKSPLRIEIEEDDDLELCKLFTLSGEEFDTQLAKISDEKKKRDLLTEYNRFWKRAEAVAMFNNGFNWVGGEFPMLAEDYLKIESINSPYLNEILVDGLISRDIAETASHFQYNDKMSSAAILSVRNGVYDKSDLEIKNKSFIAVLVTSLSKSVGWLIGNLVSGLFIWWVTAFIASDNEMAHYILFGTIFAASLIVTALNQSKTTEAIKESREEFNFYILRDMCALHKQAEYMDTKLLRHLMYKLEERGVQINQLVYKILQHADNFN
jgi:hypothetical protein